MMRGVCFCLGLISLLAAAFALESDGVYIVYMGASPPTSDHAHILSSLITRFSDMMMMRDHLTVL